MEYVTLQTIFHRDRDVAPLSDRAFRLYVAAICESGAIESDGVLTGAQIDLLPRSGALSELVRAGRIKKRGREYVVHKWDQYQITKAELDERRAKRVEAGKLGGLASGRSRREANASSNGEAKSKHLLRQPLNGSRTESKQSKR